MHCTTLLFAPWILTQDDNRTVLEDAFIAITGNVITAIGSKDTATQITADKTIYLDNCLLMPGLINAHTHIPMTFLRGFADDLPLMQWLTEHIFPAEQHLTQEIVQLGALLGCAELTRTGTTTFCDMYLFEQAVYEATHQAGLRILGGEALFAFPSPAYSTFEQGIALAEEHMRTWQHSQRIRPCVMPHSVYTTNKDILMQCQSLAQQYQVPLVIHAAESQTEAEAAHNLYGKSTLTLLDELDMLGSSTLLAHAVTTTPEEIALLARTQTKVTHCPKSNLKLSSGIAPIQAMIQAGIEPALGTDGPASNNTLNMFSEMNMCALLHKQNDPTALPAQTVLDMSTRYGAKALQWEGIGSLEVGNQADIIALNLQEPNLVPMFHPGSHLVYATTGHEVCFSMVEGSVLYDHGTYTHLDYPTLLKEAQKLKKWVLDHK